MKILVAILAAFVSVAAAMPAHAQSGVSGTFSSINYGSGNIVKEWSGAGAPPDACPTALAQYTQTDAPTGQNLWKCISGHMKQQGGSSSGIGTSASAPASTLYVVDSITGSKYAITVKNGAWSFANGSATLSIYLNDTATGTEYALNISSGAMTLATSSGGSPVSAVCFTDLSTGTQASLSVSSASLTQTVAPCSSAVSSTGINDSSTSASYNVAMVGSSLTLTTQ